MDLFFAPISPSQIFTISVWRYSPPYEIYNLYYPPSSKDVAYWLTPEFQVHAIKNTASQMVAFCSFGRDGQVPGGDYNIQALDIGMGVRPDLTGQGNGIFFAESVCSFARKAFHTRSLRVTVASKNVRALKVWSKVGFRPIDRFLATKTEISFEILVNII